MVSMKILNVSYVKQITANNARRIMNAVNVLRAIIWTDLCVIRAISMPWNV